MNTVNFWTQFLPVQGRISIPNSHLLTSFAHPHLIFICALPSPSQPIIVYLNNVFLRFDASRYQNDLDLKLQGIVYCYVKQTWSTLNPWNLKPLSWLMTEVAQSLFSVEVHAKMSHLQHAALWKWCALLHPMVIPSPFAIVVWVWSVHFLLMPSFLLCTGCHSMNHSS